jgi:hypothetical protein
VRAKIIAAAALVMLLAPQAQADGEEAVEPVEDPQSEQLNEENPNQCQRFDQLAGPIWNNEDARAKCPGVCSPFGATWTGHWRTIIWGRMSVCNCEICN